VLQAGPAASLARWDRSPNCNSDGVASHSRDDTHSHRQRYCCPAYAAPFHDLSGTTLVEHHRRLRVWMLCLYLMGLNLSSRQIAQELDLIASHVQAVTEQLRTGLKAKVRAAALDGEVEIEEV
jgi:transposase-like protein